jgi:hypothetical protein
MSILSKFANVSILSLSTIMLCQYSAVAETFMNPNLDGKYIDACIDSYRFQNHCSQAAKNQVSKQFCRFKGYSSVKQWASQDFGWDNRTIAWKWTEKYVDGNLQANFYANEGGNRFTAIECK